MTNRQTINYLCIVDYDLLELFSVFFLEFSLLTTSGKLIISSIVDPDANILTISSIYSDSVCDKVRLKQSIRHLPQIPVT